MVNKKAKAAIILVLVLAAIGAVVAYFMWNTPNRSVADETGIEVTAVQLVKDYQANEAQANSRYLDKALQVTGTIGDIKKNQEGKPTIMLSSDDAMTGVFCTLKEDPGSVANGETVTIKGFCSGMLSDVRLREAVIVK